MRTFLLLSATLLLAGCHCSPATPQAVTLRIVNGSNDPIYVDATGGTLGLAVERKVGDQWFAFDDAPCSCRTCDQACNLACSCPDVTPFIRRVEPGATAERTWDGVVQVAAYSQCAASGCLGQENAPVDETFTVKLCWANEYTGGVAADAGVIADQLPTAGLSCTTNTFLPRDGVVEVGPQKGAACTTTADCKGTDEKCFDGACTTGCPANGVPIYGADYQLYVTLDDQGFFTQAPRGAGTAYSGQGVLSSVIFQGTSLELTLTRTGTSGETLKGLVTVTLPPGVGPPLASGSQVSVLVLDQNSDSPARAVVVRDAATQQVLFVADMAQLGQGLAAADLSPFATQSATEPFGCRSDACGRELFFTMTLTDGNTAVTARPGSQATLTTGAGSYAFLPVADGAWETTTCTVDVLRPYTFWRKG
jgi:hypothetical protein